MSLLVLEPGPLTTVQDAGRPGWAHLGVPRSGFLDRPAATFANRLVGNPEDAALLETTAGGVSLRLLVARTVAVTGARCDVRSDTRALPWGEAVTLRAGSELVVGPALQGLRSYVALAGGVAVPAVLGSRSTDTLAGIGPPVVARGTELPLGPPGPLPMTGPGVPVSGERSPVLRWLPGPQADWLQDPAALDGARFRVGDASNRVGLRLEGEPLRRRTGEMATEGMVRGAIQAPPSGEAVLFLNDHPTTGGYPVVAVLHPGDLAFCAQLRPGDEVTVRLVDMTPAGAP